MSEKNNLNSLGHRSIRIKLTEYETIIAAMGDGVTVHDREFRILYQNRFMQENFGDRIGNRCYSTYEGNDKVCDNCQVEKCFADGQTHTAERTIGLEGEGRIFEVTASPLRDKSGRIIAAVEVVRDITARKRTEFKLSRFMNMYAALSHTNKAIMESRSKEEMFAGICAAAVDFGKFPLALIGLTDREGIVRPVAHSGIAMNYLDAAMTVHVDAYRREGQGPTGRAIREGVPCICNDFHNDPSTAPWRSAALENGIKASAAFPFTCQDKVVGALKVYSDHVFFFDTQVCELLTEMAASISFGLDNFIHSEQRRKSETDLRESEKQLKLVLEGSNDGFCDWHIPSATVQMSPRYAEILGFSLAELSPTPETIRDLIHPDDWPSVAELLHNESSSRHPFFEMEVRMRTKDGSWKWLSYRGKVVEWEENGAPVRVAGTCADVTDKKMYEEKLRHSSTHDQLTGLFNRAFFDAEFDRLKGGRDFPVSVVMADVDGLKRVNDTFGHAAGDRLIREGARVLRDAFRSDDIVARIGGDEFAVLLPNADARVVKEGVKRVLAALAHEDPCAKDTPLSLSLGTATAEHGAQLSEALKAADADMYRYKARRKELAQRSGFLCDMQRTHPGAMDIVTAA